MGAGEDAVVWRCREEGGGVEEGWGSRRGAMGAEDTGADRQAGRRHDGDSGAPCGEPPVTLPET